jgi:hypothetical protein
MMKFRHSASIEQFLSKEMTPVEEQNFAKELATNKELAAEFRFSQQIDKALRREDILDIRQKMSSLYEQQKASSTQNPVIKMYPRRWYFVAASVVAVLAIGATLLFTLPSRNSNDALFNQYYTSENVLDVTRSGDANIVEAIIKFQEKDFKMAAWQFGKILAKDESNMAVWFYYGISSIETKSFQNAETAFQKIISDNNNLYVEHAEWYLSLCYLKSDQTDKAVSQLNKIAGNENNFHQQEALTLLKKISKN